MKSVSSYQKEASDEIKSAETLLFETYSLTKDEKIFLSILTKLYNSIQLSMNAYLGDEITSKSTFNNKLSLLRTKVQELNLSEGDFEFVTLIEKLYFEHQESNVEFSRKEKFIIVEGDYTLHTLSLSNLNEYLNKTKKIVAELLMNVKN